MLVLQASAVQAQVSVPMHATEVEAPILRSPPRTVESPVDRTLVAATTLGAGAAIGVAGLLLYAWTSRDESELQSRYQQRDDQGLISGITYRDAVNVAGRVETMQNVAAVAGTVGVAAVAAGLYVLLTTRPERCPTWEARPLPGVAWTSVRVGPGGLRLGWEF